MGSSGTGAYYYAREKNAAQVIFGVWKIWAVPCELPKQGVSTLTTAGGGVALLRLGAPGSSEQQQVELEVELLVQGKKKSGGSYSHCS